MTRRIPMLCRLREAARLEEPEMSPILARHAPSSFAAIARAARRWARRARTEAMALVLGHEAPSPYQLLVDCRHAPNRWPH
jgi:hypothetical protein